MFKKETLEDQTRKILENAPDPHGVVTESFVANAQVLMAETQKERHELDFSPYGHMHKVILLCEMVRTKAKHVLAGNVRHDGTDYFDEHLMGTMRGLIRFLGVTSVPSLVAAMHHDDLEDLKELKRNPARLVGLEEYGISEVDLPPDLRDIRVKVHTLVTGVTKIERLGGRAATDAATFVHLLKMMKQHGVHVPFVKLADRGHNIQTISSHRDPQRRVEIAQETESVYALLANVLKVQQMVRHLVHCCALVLNPALVDYFENALALRLAEHLGPYRALIESEFHAKRAEDRLQRKFLHFSIARDVEFHPIEMADVMPKGVGASNLEGKDLLISPVHPGYEVLVLTKPLAELHQVVAYILHHFGGEGVRVEVIMPHDEKPPKRGAIVKIHKAKFGGVLIFRVNDYVSEARAKRGVLAGLREGVSPDMGVDIDYILRMTSHGREAHVFDVARERMLRPTVTVYTPDDEPMELPKGSTVLDFAAAVHGDLLIGLQGAVASRHIFDDRFEPVGIFDELQDKTVIRLDSCLDSDAGRCDFAQIKVDPGWLLFCQTERARDQLRKRYLRVHEGRSSSVGMTFDGKEYSFPTAQNIIERGAFCAAKLGALFGLDTTEILAVIKQHRGKLKNAEDAAVYFQIGRGSLELLQILAETCFKDRTQWPFAVELPNKPGAMHKFTEEFTRRGINIGRVQADDVFGELVVVRFVIHDIHRAMSPFDIMKVLLALSYSYKIEVDCYEDVRQITVPLD